MNNRPLDHDVIERYRRSDVFQILICGMFIYCCGSSVAYVLSTFSRDITIFLNATSVTTLVLKELVYYFSFIISIMKLGLLVFRKIEGHNMIFDKLMWSLIIAYFLIQFVSFAYTYWGYEILGEIFLTKTVAYYSEVKEYYTYQMYIDYARFLPFIFCPVILLYFSKKLKN